MSNCCLLHFSTIGVNKKERLGLKCFTNTRRERGSLLIVTFIYRGQSNKSSDCKMSIRSENNKIMLKIESMASRNERLVNISRKCNSFPFVIEQTSYYQIYALPQTMDVAKESFMVAFAHSPGFICLSVLFFHSKYANGN